MKLVFEWRRENESGKRTVEVPNETVVPPVDTEVWLERNPSVGLPHMKVRTGLPKWRVRRGEITIFIPCTILETNEVLWRRS